MNIWLAAVIALLPALAAAIYASIKGRSQQRLVAVELAISIGVLTLALAGVAFNRALLIEIALGMALLYLPATLVCVWFIERRLRWRRS